MALLLDVYPEIALSDYSVNDPFDVTITQFQKKGRPQKNLENDEPLKIIKFRHQGIRRSDMILVRDFRRNLKGMFGDFLFRDIDDFEIFNENVGTGDAIQAQFQLARGLLVVGSLSITLDGSPTIAFSVDEQTGVITFFVAPGYGVDIEASYEFHEQVMYRKPVTIRRLPRGKNYSISVELVTST